MSPKRLGAMLKAQRARRGLTQVQLAKRARVSQSYVASLESGDRKNPSVVRLQRLARVLKVTLADLLD